VCRSLVQRIRTIASCAVPHLDKSSGRREGKWLDPSRHAAAPTHLGPVSTNNNHTPWNGRYHEAQGQLVAHADALSFGNALDTNEALATFCSQGSFNICR